MGEFVKSFGFLKKSVKVLYLLTNNSAQYQRSFRLSQAFQSKSLHVSCCCLSQKPHLQFDVKEEPKDHCNETENNEIVLKNKDIEKTADEEEDEYTSALLDYYTKKAQDDLNYMDDVEYHDIQDVNKRVFYKIVDIWLKEVGSTKRGHRDFIQTLLNSLKRFNVETDIRAYVKLLDCFPDGKHTGLKRSHWFKAAFADKIADHALGVRIAAKINEMGAVPNDKLFNKTTDLFGRFSSVTWAARALLFWYPKHMAPNPFPITPAEVKLLTPIEVAFYGLRQMNPGIDGHYHNFPVNKSKCDEVLAADKIDSVLSVQTEEQISLLAQHDTSMPIFIEGPHRTYFKGKPVQYYTMRTNPKEIIPEQNSKQRTTILTNKEWFEKFYGVDWETNQTPVHQINEEFFPSIDVVDGYDQDYKSDIAMIDKDIQKVEGPVYALACTDFTSNEALLTWVRGLLPQNPVLRQCSVVFREEDAFLLNAPKDDPNESLYENIELPHYY